MNISLKNLSIRAQVLLPVLFTTLTLVVALWVTKANLDHEQQAVKSNTDALVLYKDILADIDDQVYPLRISAVYAIYDSSRRKQFVDELQTTLSSINKDFDLMANNAEFRQDVNVTRSVIENYIQFSH